LFKADSENAKSVAALGAFGVPFQDIRPEALTDRNSFVRERKPTALDIHPSIRGLEFTAAWKRRVESVVDEITGTEANFVSADY